MTLPASDLKTRPVVRVGVVTGISEQFLGIGLDSLYNAFYMRLCVVDLNGRRISGRMALVHNVLRLIDAWPGLYIVGLIVARMSPLYQRLGDRVAHTLVVEATSVPLARYSCPAMLRRLLLLVSIATLFAAFCLSFSYYERPPLVIESWKNINNTYGFGLAAPFASLWTSGIRF